MHEQLRTRLLSLWSGLVSRRPGWVLFIATAVAVASVTVTFTRLRFEPDRNRLIADDLEWNQWFNDWRFNFAGNTDLTIVVDTWRDGTPDDEHLAAAQSVVGQLAARLKSDTEHVASVVWGFDTRRVGARALRTLNGDEFETQVQQLEQSRPLLASRGPLDLLGHVESTLKPAGIVEAVATGAAGKLPQLKAVLDAFDQVLKTPPGERKTLAGLVERTQSSPEHRIQSRAEHWRYLASQPRGRFLFIRVTPRSEASKINALGSSIKSIRGVMNDVAHHHQHVEFGLTGIEVVEADETDAATRDSAVASIVAFVLIGALLMSAFHSWRAPLLALVALLYGIAWTFGYLTLVVGHLQVISVVFCVILLGLGIAYGIHLASRFELVRHEYPDGPDGFAAALRDSFTTMGPGIVTGAVTTAAAFVTTIFTDFKGVGEMGTIAAGGILLCLVAMFSVFPALLRLVKPRHKHVRPMESRLFHFFEENWVMPFVRWPRVTLVVAAVLTLTSLVIVSRMHFDYNLMALQPRGAESVEWQERIATGGGHSIFAAVCIVDNLDAAGGLTAALRQLETVEQVGGVGLLFPKDESVKLQRLAEARDRLDPDLSEALRAVPQGQRTPIDVGTFAVRFVAFAQRIRPMGNVVPPLIELADTADRLAKTSASLPPPLAVERMAHLQSEFDQWRRQTAQRIIAALDSGPLQFEDMPADLMRPYRDERGRLVLEVYPRHNSDQFQYDSPLNPRFMPRFIADVRGAIDRQFGPATASVEQEPLLVRKLNRAIAAVDKPEVAVRSARRPILTGPMMQFYESGQLILDSYRIAGVAALVVVFCLVWVDFQRSGEAFLTLVPVGVGFAITFAAMWLMGMTINPANIIVLPLMFGIGVDSGVHVLHRFRQEKRTRPLGLTEGTGKGITITSLTAMIGFGALMLARHRGIFSLGLVMTLGIGLTMLACLTIMPAWLELHQRAQARWGAAQ